MKFNGTIKCFSVFNENASINPFVYSELFLSQDNGETSLTKKDGREVPINSQPS